MTKAQIIKTNITNLSHDSRGLGKDSTGKTVFLLGGLPNEEVEGKIFKKNAKFSEGKITEVLANKSPFRVDPKCVHFGNCGGCQLQHLDYAKQIEHKLSVARDLLTNFGNIDLSKVEFFDPIIDEQYGYRGKARLGVYYNKKTDTVSVGFREYQGRKLINVGDCSVLSTKLNFKIADLTSLVESLSIKDKIAQIEIAVGYSSCGVILRNLDKFQDSDYLHMINFAKQYNVWVYEQPDNYSSVRKIYPDDNEFELDYYIPKHDILFKFHPSDFTQVNYHINCKMLDMAIDIIKPNDNMKVLDLFCGVGNFSLLFARYVKHVNAVEVVKEMVDKAIQNAKINNLTNINFFVENLQKETFEGSWSNEKYDVLIIDPPRTGAKDVCDKIHLFDALTILYISCNPATFARDAKILSDKGYQLSKFGIIDMFPNTKHIEVIGIFRRGG